jgi:hypothetical protein
MLISSCAAITLFKCPSINSVRTSVSRAVNVDRRASISVATALRSALATARCNASHTLSPRQPRRRRDCLGELVQIDGSEHAWFETRGEACTLLAFVDDATRPAAEQSGSAWHADEEPDAAGWLATHLSRDQRTNGCSMMLGGGCGPQGLRCAHRPAGCGP